jgi:hypothetical protein
MEIPELFPVSDIEFSDSKKFHEYLINNYNPKEVPHNLTMLVGISEHSTNDLLKKLQEFNFQIKRQLGNVYHIINHFDDERIEAYLTHDEKEGIVIFYTNYRKTEEIPKIQDFLIKDTKSFQLFLRPPMMEDITDTIFCNNEYAEILAFTAKYSPGAYRTSRIRPNTDRSISYWGIDGKDALQEMEYYYGISPSMIHVKVPDTIVFRIKEEGLFTYHSGKIGSIEILFNLMEKAINDSMNFMKAYKQTSFRMLSVETEEKSFNIPVATPALINLKSKLRYHEISNFEKGFSFIGTVVNSFVEEGSLFYCADIITESGEEFRVKANENQIKIFPREICHLNTFMSFYKFIVDSFDPMAEFKIRGG